MVKAKPTTPTRRHGFTLVELLIVIVVISILAALILPAVGNVRNSARIAGVRAEISQLDSAIAAFKQAHGIEPPSSITLYETGTDWSGTGADTVNSRAIIQQIWPQFDFTKNRDLNNDHDGGASHEYYTLTPSECLVLFLGGMYTTSNSAFTMIGFSKDPTDPFASTATGVPRDKPLFEFQSARLCDVAGIATGASVVTLGSNGIPEYLDNLPGQKLPYLYYSSYDGTAYNTSSSSPEFNATVATTNLPGAPVMCIPYYQDTALSNPWKANSHQIISPGFDKSYGYGGAYVSSTLSAATSGRPAAVDRLLEADNITNFSNGVLQP